MGIFFYFELYLKRCFISANAYEQLNSPCSSQYEINIQLIIIQHNRHCQMIKKNKNKKNLVIHAMSQANLAGIHMHARVSF